MPDNIGERFQNSDLNARRLEWLKLYRLDLRKKDDEIAALKLQNNLLREKLARLEWK